MFRHLLQPRASKGIASVLFPRITLQVLPFLVVPLRSISYSSIMYRKIRVQEENGLSEKVRGLEMTVLQQQQQIEEITNLIDDRKLTQIVKGIRGELIRRKFLAENPLPFIFLSEIEECSKGTKNFKMTDTEILKWKKFKLELAKEGLTIEQVEEDINNWFQDFLVLPK